MWLAMCREDPEGMPLIHFCPESYCSPGIVRAPLMVLLHLVPAFTPPVSCTARANGICLVACFGFVGM